jgi:hypothetical protein
MSATAKTFTIEERRERSFKGKLTLKIQGTLEELIQQFSYTLELGKAYENKKGNKKVNLSPKTISSLIKNLYNASNNVAWRKHSGLSYTVI